LAESHAAYEENRKWCPSVKQSRLYLGQGIIAVNINRKYIFKIFVQSVLQLFRRTFLLRTNNITRDKFSQTYCALHTPLIFNCL